MTLIKLTWVGIVIDFKNTEQFLDKLPTVDGYDYAIEFRHPSWGTEGTWEMLKHYNIAAVMTDSPRLYSCKNAFPRLSLILQKHFNRHQS